MLETKTHAATYYNLSMWRLLFWPKRRSHLTRPCSPWRQQSNPISVHQPVLLCLSAGFSALEHSTLIAVHEQILVSQQVKQCSITFMVEGGKKQRKPYTTNNFFCTPNYFCFVCILIAFLYFHLGLPSGKKDTFRMIVLLYALTIV